MFDDLLRELNNLSSGIRIPVTVAVDEAGYLDRQCPSGTCRSRFKVLGEDWKAKVTENQAYCPLCRLVAPPSDFNTPEQVAYFQKLAKAEVMRRLHGALHSGADTFNRRQTRGFITMQLKVDTPAVRVPVPREAEEAMTLRITCGQCGCQCAVVGAGYFCPACGHNSADTTFDQSVERARNAMVALPQIQVAMQDRDVAAQTAQNLTEGTLSNLVTAFQHFAAAVYPRLPNPAVTPRRNAFQSIAEGSQLWHNAGGRPYSDILGATEMADLLRLFQQRHALQHTQGIVDQEYVNRSGDTSYNVGQRIVVREAAVLRLAELLEKLVGGMRSDLH